jgi:diguanylate cyclase (GGDEF)-like protein
MTALDAASEPASDPYRELYDGSPCGLLTVDADGFVTGANRTLLDWSGRSEPEVVGAPFVELFPAADQLFYETRFAPILHLRGELHEVALTMSTATGSLPILLNARRTGTEIRMAVFDATERQGYERTLLAAQRAAEISESRVRVLHEAASQFAEAGTEQQLADRLVESTRQAMAATACAVVLVDASGTTTLVAGEHPLTALAADPAVHDDVMALRTAGIVVVDSVDDARARYPAFVEGLEAARIAAFSVVPIEGRDGILGALLCFFGRPRTLSPEDIDLQVTLARGAAQVLSRIRLQDELMALALYDQLTGVANRRLLREHLIQGMASSARRDHPIAMLVIDLDGFKTINDELGHQRGDRVLRWVADQLTGAVRADDIVGRFGGDEFIVICHEADEQVARAVAERARDAVARYPERLPDGASLTASVGIAICLPARAGERPEDFFAVADAALYRSKREGKNRISVGLL